MSGGAGSAVVEGSRYGGQFQGVEAGGGGSHPTCGRPYSSAHPRRHPLPAPDPHSLASLHSLDFTPLLVSGSIRLLLV